MCGGPESRCVERVYGLDGAERLARHHPNCTLLSENMTFYYWIDVHDHLINVIILKYLINVM